jgi:hypothetical protein
MKIASITTVSASPATPVGSVYRASLRAVQVQIAGTSGAAQLQGRVSSEAPWINLGTAFSADGIQFLSLPQEIRLNVTAVTAATINCWVDAQAK